MSASPLGLDIVIPMAGRGSRFAKAGFALPKPLIDVEGQPMIARVIANLRPRISHRFIFLVLEEHLVTFDLAQKLKDWAGPETVCVPVHRLTEGAACTVLLAEEHLRKDRDLMIANSDQLVEASVADFIHWSRAGGADGSIMVFEATEDKWSFAKLNAQGDVVQVAEKKPISNLATVGIYHFRRGYDFALAAREMIAKNERVNGEFYVCPVYNEMIAHGRRIVTWKIEACAMHGVGTPEDLALYLRRGK